MNGYYNGVDSSVYLAHYGVLGMKWGQHLMAKYETNRAGRALKRTITNKKDSGKYKRAEKTLSKYEGKYSKSQIAESAKRSARRGKMVTNTLGTIGKVSGAIGSGSGVIGGITGAVILAAVPGGASLGATVLGNALYTTAVSSGTYAYSSVTKRNSNVAYKTIVSELDKYAKS